MTLRLPDDEIPPCGVLERLEADLQQLAALDVKASVVAEALLEALQECREGERE